MTIHAKNYSDFIADQTTRSQLRDKVRNGAVFMLSLGHAINRTSGWVCFPYYHHVFNDERVCFVRQLGYLRHFGDTSRDKEARVLARRLGQLRGYAAVVHEDVVNIGLKHLRIADLFVENNDRAVVNDLLCAAYEYGRDQGCHVLEWIGIPTNLRGIALAHKPFARALPTWPLFYKAVHGELAGKLERPAAWYNTCLTNRIFKKICRCVR